MSAPPKHKLAAWEAHKLRYEGPCGITTASHKTKEKPTAQAKRRKSPAKSPDRSRKLPTKTKRIIDRDKEKTAQNKSKKKEAKKTIANAKSKKTEKTNSKSNEARGAAVKTKGGTTTRRAIDKIEDEPEVDEREEKSVSDRSGASETEDQSTVNEQPEFVEEESIIEEPEHEGESTVTEEPEYNDHKLVSEESTAEKKGRKCRGKQKRTECLCRTSADYESLEKIAPKEARNICTVHQRLRV